MTEWLQNESLFRSEYETGRSYEDKFADRLKASGLNVFQPPQKFRADVSQRSQYVNQVDLLVGLWVPKRIEVKSRRLAFTGPRDFPYETVFIDTLSSWEKRLPRPAAIVLISQSTGGVAVAPAGTRHLWTPEERHDNVRNITDVFLMAPRTLLRSYDDLVRWLKADDNL